MERSKIDLKKIAADGADRVVARLEGEIDDQTAKLWGEEFAASGGGKAPTPTPTPPTPSPS